MTEEQAKTKWCPFTRCEGRFVGGQPTLNRDWSTAEYDDDGNVIGPGRVQLPKTSLCIASACMAWRWGQTAGEGPFKIDHGTGYCGLAGGVRP